MRQLIESLSPEANRIHWKWIGGVFAFYVAVMTGATVVFTTHQSAKRFTTQASPLPPPNRASSERSMQPPGHAAKW